MEGTMTIKITTVMECDFCGCTVRVTADGPRRALVRQHGKGWVGIQTHGSDVVTHICGDCRQGG